MDNGKQNGSYSGTLGIHRPPPFKGLNLRILIVVPIKGTGFINYGKQAETVGLILSGSRASASVR